MFQKADFQVPTLLPLNTNTDLCPQNYRHWQGQVSPHATSMPCDEVHEMLMEAPNLGERAGVHDGMTSD